MILINQHTRINQHNLYIHATLFNFQNYLIFLTNFNTTTQQKQQQQKKVIDKLNKVIKRNEINI